MARYNEYSILDYLSPPPLHLCFFVFVLFSVLGLSLYINYESVYEDLTSRIKFFLMLSPLLLLLLVHFLSGGTFFVPLPEKEDLHRAGGSPWGVALLLVFLLFLISHQPSFHERWFPLVTK
ncbi:hypothetical protein SLE2022_357590 [Rubroshorea leprosula]